MAVTVSYPGVYIQELPSDVRVIAGVPTSITAFVGRARRGPRDTPVRVQGIGEYVRRFGGLWESSTMGYAVSQFFINGGSDAIIVRVHHESAPGADDRASATLPAAGNPQLILRAASEGTWGRQLRAIVTHLDPLSPDAANRFNLTIQEVAASNAAQVLVEERFVNLSWDPASPRSAMAVLGQESQLARVATLPANQPQLTPKNPQGQFIAVPFAGGSDGLDITHADVADANSLAATHKGMFALDSADLFNLLCIPPFTRNTDIGKPTWAAATKYCEDRRALLIVDPPANWNEGSDVTPAAINAVVDRSANAALYFPRIRAADALKENRPEEFVPSGAVAGVIARTDAARGVWKAPAGQEAAVNGIDELTVRLTNGEHGQINPIGVNCLRSFPIPGRVVWGARTLMGADEMANQWASLPVRRTALYIEESLYRGTQWVVFEPNDEPLWSQIRLNVGAFMNGLFRKGAFQGNTPAKAYFVRCDRETNPQEDIDRGIVNIVVGFAPLKPAEFVVISIMQMRPEA